MARGCMERKNSLYRSSRTVGYVLPVSRACVLPSIVELKYSLALTELLSAFLEIALHPPASASEFDSTFGMSNPFFHSVVIFLHCSVSPPNSQAVR
jgi:hypothetical protein